MSEFSWRNINELPQRFPLPQQSYTVNVMRFPHTSQACRHAKASIVFTISHTLTDFNRWKTTNKAPKRMEQGSMKTGEMRSSSPESTRRTGMKSDSYCPNSKTYVIDILAVSLRQDIKSSWYPTIYVQCTAPRTTQGQQAGSFLQRRYKTCSKKKSSIWLIQNGPALLSLHLKKMAR